MMTAMPLEIWIEGHKYACGQFLQTFLQPRKTETTGTCLEMVFANPTAQVTDSGWLFLWSAVGRNEVRSDEVILGRVISDFGKSFDDGFVCQLVLLNGASGPTGVLTDDVADLLAEYQAGTLLSWASSYFRSLDAPAFSQALDEASRWAEAQKAELEKKPGKVTRQIKLNRTTMKTLETLEAKVERLRKIKELEQERSRLRRSFFDESDKIDLEAEIQINHASRSLQRTVTITLVAAIHWTLNRDDRPPKDQKEITLTEIHPAGQARLFH